jgi:hypothetical protein
MPLLAADPVVVEPAQREALEALVRAYSTSQQLALRARTILHAADNIRVRERTKGRLPEANASLARQARPDRIFGNSASRLITHEYTAPRQPGCASRPAARTVTSSLRIIAACTRSTNSNPGCLRPSEC